MELMLVVMEVHAVVETVVLSEPVAAKRALMPGPGMAAGTAVVEMAVVSAVVVVESTAAAAAAAADVAVLEVVPYLDQMMVASTVMEAAGASIDFVADAVAVAVAVIVDREVLLLLLLLLPVESVGAILEERAIGDHIPNANAANQSRGPAFW